MSFVDAYDGAPYTFRTTGQLTETVDLVLNVPIGAEISVQY